MFMTGVLCTVCGAQVYLYGISEKPSYLVAFYDMLGIRRDTFSTKNAKVDKLTYKA